VFAGLTGAYPNSHEEIDVPLSVLVAYATRFGSTQEVAEAVAATLRCCGKL
jgi:flavorubredoxin